MALRPLEFLKDLVGIIDDAEDVRQDLEPRFAKMQGIIQRVSEEGKGFAQRLASTDQKDIASIKSMIELVGEKAPFLWRNAKEVGGMIRSLKNRMSDLRQRVGSKVFPAAERAEASRILRKAEGELTKFERVNARTIRLYDDLVKLYNRHLSKFRKIFAATVGTSLALGVAAPLAVGAAGGALPAGLEAARGVVVLSADIATVITSIIKGAKEGRVLGNLATGLFMSYIGIVQGLWWILRKVGQGAAAGLRGGRDAAVAAIRTIAPEREQQLAPA